MFQRPRVLAGERDVDRQTATLTDLFPDDVDQEFGVLVTQDGRVIEFMIYYGSRGDLKQQASEATIGEWKDITSWWQRRVMRPTFAMPSTSLRAGVAGRQCDHSSGC